MSTFNKLAWSCLLASLMVFDWMVGTVAGAFFIIWAVDWWVHNIPHEWNMIVIVGLPVVWFTAEIAKKIYRDFDEDFLGGSK